MAPLTATSRLVLVLVAMSVHDSEAPLASVHVVQILVLSPPPCSSSGGLASRRNILIFPRGNREVTGTTISLYLNVADNETAPVGWSRTAKFTLSVVDQRDPDKSASKGTHDSLARSKTEPDTCMRTCRRVYRRLSMGLFGRELESQIDATTRMYV